MGGFVAGDCHEGTKAQRNTKVFAAERVNGGCAEMIFCGDGLMRVIATEALRLKETRRFLPRRKELKEVAQR